jgi:predicted enzyme related to lactoylglutathione lyase
MPTRDHAPEGAPCWVDLMTRDVDGARKFYSDVFGWTSTDPDAEFGGYFMFYSDGDPVGGGMAPTGPEVPDCWTVYLASPDAAASVARVTEHGGEIVAPTMAVGTLGTMAVVRDPGGAVVGIWQADTFPGFVRYAEPGTAQWSEVYTRDFAEVAAFYPAVFGWETESMGDTDEFRYTVGKRGEENLAGVMDGSNWLPEGVPSHWSVYFGVDDADATITKIVAGGGSVIMPAEDTPYGRLAAVADPTGAAFRIMQAV